MKSGSASRVARELGKSLLVVPIALALGTFASSAEAADFAGVDALQASHAPASRLPSGYRATVQANLGIPEFLKAGRSVPNQAGSMLLVSDPAPIARTYLKSLAEVYRISAAEIDALDVFDSQRLRNGAAIVRFENRVDGVAVFRDGFNVLIRADGSLDTVSGYASGANGDAAMRRFARSAEQSIASALRQDFNFVSSSAATAFTLSGEAGDYASYATSLTGANGETLLQDARVKPVYFRTADGLTAAHYVELNVGSTDGERYYSYVISAQDGSILFRNNLTADLSPFSYRVWADTTAPFVPYAGPQGRNGTPHPTGQPDGYQAPFTQPNLVTLVNAITDPASVAVNDPWLADAATETVGNNVNAYANLTGGDALNAPGDYRADVTSARTFDRVYDTTKDPQVDSDQIKASVTQLFYMNNFLHDWYYDAGFDEPARNAQTSNYGRGGNQNDEIQAQAQDVSGTDNANMGTPSDGGKPRMRMFVFNGAGGARITYSDGLSGEVEPGTGAFGPTNFDLTNTIVRPAPLDACAALTNTAEVAGKIVLVDRGGCDFNAKAKTAETAGAAAVIIANVATSNNPGDAPGMAASTPPIPVTIGTLSLNLADGNALRTAVGAGTVTAHMERASGIRRDGTIDDGIIAHEWGHYISNRLVGNANGLSTNQAGGMGEGFGDFHAMLLLVRAEDAASAATPDFTGVYANGAYTASTFVTLPGQINNGYYEGIRRYPYSIDMSKNPLTYRHIVDGVALPTTPPPAFGASGGSNSEVHATGEVWASMLWECYASLLRDSDRLSFLEAQDRMKRYLVAGYKLMPNAPTFITARDAILSAIQSQSEEDYALCGAGFAKRGLGAGAVAGSPNDNSGAVESFVGFDDTIFANGFDAD
ncbi:M36 family metallopeptidase [Dokdonella sp.]|uniref:M36 family metallopeptidase n=1 Tax=Dokdonella sp. TaxID=2291710 RepID=UPI001B0B91F1|nr:M36 family metallopeptidase [Dokdonella sp.]MBO9663521.1 M36 family metallopeptidase [Dokdonella sp.]